MLLALFYRQADFALEFLDRVRKTPLNTMKEAFVPSRAQLEAIVAETQGASMLLDGEGRVLYLSKTLFASSLEEAFRRGGLDGVDPEDAQIAKQEFQRCCASPGMPIRVRIRKRLGDGTIHVVEGV